MLNLFRSKSTPMETSESTEIVQEQETKVLDPVSVNFNVELGCGKGWPPNANVVLFHHHQGYLCVGTTSGALYCYGNGFQFMSRYENVVEDVPIISLQSIYPDKLLVLYQDNTLACYEVPKLTFICTLTQSQWLSPRERPILNIYIDEGGLRPYVYAVSSDNTINVIDCSSTLRISDYSIQLSSSIPTPHTLTSMSICPKDERYLALGYQEVGSNLGCLILFDMMKQKVTKLFNCSGITSLVWNHSGDYLYAGSCIGDVYSLHLDKLSFGPIYHSRSSQINEDDDVNIAIKKLTWLAPQTNMESGCLFILLNILDDSSEVESIVKEIIIGLSPLGKGGDIKQVYSLPPIPSTILLDIQLIPVASMLLQTPSTPQTKSRSESFSSHASTSNASSVNEDDNASSSSSCRPGLLLFVEKKSRKNQSKRQLLITALPKTAVSEWILEIGSMLPPKKLWLTTGSGNITSINASKPTTSPQSLVGMLLGSYRNMAKEYYSTKQRSNSSSHEVIRNPPFIKPKIETTDYLLKFKLDSVENESDDDDDPHIHDDELAIDVVVGHADLESIEIDLGHPSDVVFVGQDDGYVVCYGVTRPDVISNPSRNNAWIPLLAIKNGYNTITNVSFDDNAGLLVTADVTGKVIVWEIFDSSTDVGYIQTQKSLLFPNQSESSVNLDPIDSNDENISACPLTYHPNNIRYVSKFDINSGAITQLKIISEYLMIVIGTITGGLYTIALYEDNPSPVSVNLLGIGLSEPVSNLVISSYYRLDLGEWSPAVYVSYQSNHVLIFHPISHEILAYCPGPTSTRSANPENESYYDNDFSDDDTGKSSKTVASSVAFGCVLDGTDNIVQCPLNPSEIISSTSRPILLDDRPSGLTRKSVLPFFNRTTSEAVSPAPSNIEMKRGSVITNKQVPVHVPTEAPHSLVILSDRQLLTYNIHKFSSPKKINNNSVIAMNANPIIMYRTISTSNIIAGKLVNYIEEATRAWSDPIPCLLITNSSGGVFALRLKDKSSVGYVNLFDHVITAPIKFPTAIVLENGVCYFTLNGALFSARASSTTHILSQPLPVRGIVSSFHSAPSLLSTGREKFIGSMTGNAKTKKRQSLMTSVTDLDKLFSKTREQRVIKEDHAIEQEGKTTGSEESIAKNVKQNIQSTSAVMNETKQLLAQRGEKLEQLNKASEEVRQGAQTFHEVAKATKDQLKQKNSRWGLF